MKTLYDELDVAEDASEDEIRKAYHRMMIAFHPDNYHGDPGYARQKTVRVKKAYDVLRDKDRRLQYDESLQLYDENGDWEEEEPDGQEDGYEARAGRRCAPGKGRSFYNIGHSGSDKASGQKHARNDRAHLVLVSVLAAAVVVTGLLASFVFGRVSAAAEGPHNVIVYEQAPLAGRDSFQTGMR